MCFEIGGQDIKGNGQKLKPKDHKPLYVGVELMHF